ncbi:uncharacterized protein LOC129793426 isoform X2 [Lutzomyia longipalpis]|nr:uncharacterized protein LOC129793426 isoform X2 [Lutzomyia longipalpis]XP_055689408.1 uncharacterized protein LOC129793426 isoform X2 [Lutzomyia longipalpis]
MRPGKDIVRKKSNLCKPLTSCLSTRMLYECQKPRSLAWCGAHALTCTGREMLIELAINWRDKDSHVSCAELPKKNIIMKIIFVTLLVCLLAFVIVSAVPIDETVVGDVYEADNFNPQDPNSFFKLKKLKKLLLLG